MCDSFKYLNSSHASRKVTLWNGRIDEDRTRPFPNMESGTCEARNIFREEACKWRVCIRYLQNFVKGEKRKKKKNGTKERRGETGWDRTYLGVLLLGRQLDAAAGAGRGGKGLVEGRRDEKTREESLFSPDEPSLAVARSQSAAPVSRRVPSPHLFGGSFPLVRLLSINDYFKSAETACNKSVRKSAFELFFYY